MNNGTHRNFVNFLISILEQTTILCLPSDTRVMLVCAVAAAHKVSTVIHSICHPLHVLWMCPHDANVTVAIEVAQRASKIDFQLERSAKQS